MGLQLHFIFFFHIATSLSPQCSLNVDHRVSGLRSNFHLPCRWNADQLQLRSTPIMFLPPPWYPSHHVKFSPWWRTATWSKLPWSPRSRSISGSIDPLRPTSPFFTQHVFQVLPCYQFDPKLLNLQKCPLKFANVLYKMQMNTHIYIKDF